MLIAPQKDHDLKLPYGKVLIEASSKLLIAARSCINVEEADVDDIEKFESAINHYLSIESDEELETPLEDMMSTIGKLGHAWLLKIKQDKSYKASLIFQDVLDIAHTLHETEEQSPSLHDPVITLMVAFMNKWSA